jgi:putative peptide zinc metalloprotease protein
MDGTLAGRPHSPGAATRWPALREDLRLFRAAPNRDGSPAWMIHDPVSNRFFRIGWVEFEVLSRWSLGDPERIVAAITGNTPLRIDASDVAHTVEFLRRQQLLRVDDPGGVALLEAVARQANPARWKWLLHNYLFVRIPLVRPQRFLGWLAPRVGFLYTRGCRLAVLLATLLGLLLAARQWDVFIHTFGDMMSPAGIAGFGVALLVAKSLHELGHAVTATRLGVRVAHMGVAFLVLWPMLYTDTGESWKLADRRDRFRIAAAGMAVEFALAGLATLAWGLVDDGALRSALFFLATTSWVLTLAINASPFMRFDGYFLLSDALDLPNLHARSFAFARAALRRWILGLREPDPEVLEPALRRFLVGFAFATWLYRLVVFVGIAVAVYHVFFKALGLLLFAVEIAWFVLRPLWSELVVWRDRRSEVGRARGIALLLVLAALVALLALPWRSAVRAEAWLHSAQQQRLYSPFAARLVELPAEGPVRAGARLALLDSPDTRSRAEQAGILAAALALQRDQSIGRRIDAAEKAVRLGEELARQLAELGAQRGELARLELRADFDGQVVDLDPELRPGGWVSANEPIAMVIDPDAWVLDAMVEQRDLDRVRVGAVATFYRRGDWEVLRGEVVAIDSARAQRLPDPMLAADRGGRIPVLRGDDGRETPRDALYRVRIRIEGAPSQLRSGLGSARIEGEPRSVLAEAFRSVAAVLVRESGF